MSKRKNYGKELALEKWGQLDKYLHGQARWKKILLLPIPSGIAGVRENLGISKARRFFLGFLLPGLFPGSDPAFPRAGTGGRGCPRSAVTSQEMGSFPH